MTGELTEFKEDFENLKGAPFKKAFFDASRMTLIILSLITVLPILVIITIVKGVIFNEKNE